MNVTAQQAAAIKNRDNPLRVVFAPPAHVARWTLGRPVVLRRLTIDEESGRSYVPVTVVAKPGAEPERVVVTLKSFGPVQALAEITLVQARAAGYRTTADFLKEWSSLHPNETAVCEVSFDFGDTRDRPRLLAASPGRVHFRTAPKTRKWIIDHTGTTDDDYTPVSSLALIEEPEAVDDVTLAKFSKEAERGDAERVAEQRKEQYERMHAAANKLRRAAADPRLPASGEMRRQVREVLHVVSQIERTVADMSATLR